MASIACGVERIVLLWETGDASSSAVDTNMKRQSRPRDDPSVGCACFFLTSRVTAWLYDQYNTRTNTHIGINVFPG